MKLDTSKWQPFQINKIFKVYTGSDLIMGDIEDGDIPIASNSAENNNIAAYTSFIENRKLFDHTKSISIADRGKFWAFIQPKDFYIATRVKALVCLDYNQLNIYQLSFIVSIINQESFKFTYGRNCCANLSEMKISLPFKQDIEGKPIIDTTKKYSEDGYVPDWEWMEDYIKSLHHKPLTTKNKPNSIQFNIENWKTFHISRTSIRAGLFDIENCKCGSAGNLDEGFDINYIGAKKNDNGVMRKVARDEALVSKGNGIMFICDGEGSVGYTNYMDEDFIGSTTTSIGYDEALNRYNAMFLVAILDKEKYKFSYGRKYRAHIDEITIKLPIKYNSDKTPYIDGNKKYSSEGYIPDWKWMENYIKSLPYGDRL